MKVYLLILTVVLSFVSCSKHPEPDIVEPDYSQMTEEECIAYAHSNGAITIAEFNEIVKASLHLPTESDFIRFQDRATPVQSVTGYDSHYELTNTPSKKVWINDPGSGLPPGMYFANAHLVLKKIKCEADKLYTVADSPQCGYDPDEISIGTKRGYAGHMSSGYWKMQSIAYYIKQKLNGQAINRFYPLEPAYSVWNYKADTLQ